MLNLQDHRRIPHWQLALAVLQALMTPPKLQPFVKESPWWQSSNAEQPIISYLNRWPTATPFLPTYYTSCPGKHNFVSKRWLSWGDLSFLGQLGSGSWAQNVSLMGHIQGSQVLGQQARLDVGDWLLVFYQWNGQCKFNQLLPQSMAAAWAWEHATIHNI